MFFRLLYHNSIAPAVLTKFFLINNFSFALHAKEKLLMRKNLASTHLDIKVCANKAAVSHMKCTLKPLICDTQRSRMPASLCCDSRKRAQVIAQFNVRRLKGGS